MSFTLLTVKVGLKVESALRGRSALPVSNKRWGYMPYPLADQPDRWRSKCFSKEIAFLKYNLITIHKRHEGALVSP